MARKIELSPAARHDVRKIAAYGAAEFGFGATNRYREALEEKLRLIASFPEIGPVDPLLGEDVRGLTAMSHRIVYCARPDHILILRVLHALQLPPGLA